MASEQDPTGACVVFASGKQASRRIAGVSVAGRIARELSEAGFANVWLVLPPDEELDRAATADVTRLAAGTAHFGRPADEPGIVQFQGDRFERPGAETEIIRQTGKSVDGLISRWLNRPISQRLTQLLLHIPGLKPAHATAGTALLAMMMFAAFVAGGANGAIAGAVLFQAASIFDGVDGEIARATFRASPAGAVLDTIVDVATNLLFIVGLTVNLGFRGHDQAYALGSVGLALLIVGLGLIGWRSVGTGGHFTLDGVKHHYSGRYSGPLAPAVIRLLTIVSSRDFFALLFMVVILAGAPMGVLYIFAAATAVWIVFVVATVLPGRKAASEGA